MFSFFSPLFCAHRNVFKQTNFSYLPSLLLFFLLLGSLFANRTRQKGQTSFDCFFALSRAFCAIRFRAFSPMSKWKSTTKAHKRSIARADSRPLHNKESSTIMVNCFAIPKTENNKNKFATKKAKRFASVSKWKRRVIMKVHSKYDWKSRNLCPSRILNTLLGERALHVKRKTAIQHGIVQPRPVSICLAFAECSFSMLWADEANT